jgi:hypothetical protein
MTAKLFLALVAGIVFGALAIVAVSVAVVM